MRHHPVLEQERFNILLVDDDPRVLSALRRRMNQLSPNLNIDVAVSGEEAIEASQEKHFHLVMSDLRMPRTSGTSVLAAVRRRCPGTLRVILSGQATVERLMEVLPFSHRYLEKPCSQTELKRVLELTSFAASCRLSPALLNQILTLTSLPCDGGLLSLLEDKLNYGAPTHEIDQLMRSELGMSLALLRVTTNVLGSCTVPQDFSPSISALPPHLLPRLLNSHLLFPVSDHEELQRCTRLISIKYQLLEHQLRSAEIECASLLAMLSYLGELALLACVGPNYLLLPIIYASRDEVAKILGSMWGVSPQLLQVLDDPDLLALRKEIDGFFPLDEFFLISNEDLLELYREVLCWIH